MGCVLCELRAFALNTPPPASCVCQGLGIEEFEQVTQLLQERWRLTPSQALHVMWHVEQDERYRAQQTALLVASRKERRAS